MKRHFLFFVYFLLSYGALAQFQKYESFTVGKPCFPKLFLINDSSFVLYSSCFYHDMSGDELIMSGHYIQKGTIIEMKDDNSSYIFSFKKGDSTLIPIKFFESMVADTFRVQAINEGEKKQFSYSRSQFHKCECDKKAINISPMGDYSDDGFNPIASNVEDRGYLFCFKNDMFSFYYGNELLLFGKWLLIEGTISLYDENTGTVLKIKSISKDELCIIDFPFNECTFYKQ